MYRPIPELSPHDILRFVTALEMNVNERGCWRLQTATKPSGHATFTIDRDEYRASRVSKKLFVGEDYPQLMVRHLCFPWCVNPSPDHTIWGDARDNRQDEIDAGTWIHGELHANSKLTDTIVLEILRRASSGEWQIDLANEFGVSRTVLSHICARHSWKHLNHLYPDPIRKQDRKTRTSRDKE